MEKMRVSVRVRSCVLCTEHSPSEVWPEIIHRARHLISFKVLVLP